MGLISKLKKDILVASMVLSLPIYASNLEEKSESLPIELPLKSVIGGSIGDTLDFEIDSSFYKVKINNYAVKNGFLYPSTLVTKFDINGDGILSSEELEAGTKDTCKICTGYVSYLLDKYPKGVKILPFSNKKEISDSIRKISCSRTEGLRDVYGVDIPCRE
jgi:hypothetical protein